MKIGLGVITSGKRALHPEYSALSESGCLFHVFIDKDRRGGAFNRNQVIKSLYDAGCDYIFLMDDDVWPVRENWQVKFIEWAEKHACHFIGTPWPETRILQHRDDLLATDGMTIQFCMLSRKAIETIGYLDQRFGMYAPEDAEYAWRAKENELTGPEWYSYPPWLRDFIHIEDFFSCFKSSTFTDEQKAEGMQKASLISHKMQKGETGFIPYDQSYNHSLPDIG